MTLVWGLVGARLLAKILRIRDQFLWATVLAVSLGEETGVLYHHRRLVGDGAQENSLVLAGFLTPTGGRALVDGRPVEGEKHLAAGTPDQAAEGRPGPALLPSRTASEVTLGAHTPKVAPPSTSRGPSGSVTPGRARPWPAAAG